MKLHSADTGRLNTVTGYGAGYIEINAVRHQGAILLMPEGDIRQWQPSSDGKLDSAQTEGILALSPEIVLLGTGPSQRFQEAQVVVAFHRAGVGLETMDTAAACRTYNILMAEGRRVLAALMPT